MEPRALFHALTSNFEHLRKPVGEKPERLSRLEGTLPKDRSGGEPKIARGRAAREEGEVESRGWSVATEGRRGERPFHGSAGSELTGIRESTRGPTSAPLTHRSTYLPTYPPTHLPAEPRNERGQADGRNLAARRRRTRMESAFHSSPHPLLAPLIRILTGENELPPKDEIETVPNFGRRGFFLRSLSSIQTRIPFSIHPPFPDLRSAGISVGSIDSPPLSSLRAFAEGSVRPKERGRVSGASLPFAGCEGKERR
ncbi:hypothetical protein KM043_002989 [Ampulex compressa]|nr:hypothetical protein KM043_002989 [Ampulex compressa]